MKKVFAGIAVLGLVVGLIGTSTVVQPEEASAQAFVLNFGSDGLVCTLAGAFAGAGHATFVATPSGNIMFQCAGGLTSPAPSSAIVTTASGPFGTACHLTVTPGGRFAASCH